MKVQGWDTEPGDWYVYSKSDYTYTETGELLTEKNYALNTENKELELEYDELWIYDANGNGTSWISTGTEYSEKVEIQYDLSAQAENYSLPYSMEMDLGVFYNKPVSFEYYEFSEPDWYLLGDALFYYSDDISSIVYPVPAFNIKVIHRVNSFTVSWGSKDEYLRFNIYDVTGKKVYSGMVENHQTLTMRNLPGGVYIYSIGNNKMLARGKFFVE